MINRIFTGKSLRQFISYFFVGGVAAIVEWVMFYLFDSVFHIAYLFATVLAFAFSTTTNLILGRMTTFKGSKQYEGKVLAETVAIFAVSIIGLGFNLILMYLFVSVMGFDTSIQKTCSKIVATGIVFIWNFLIRKFVVYKD